MVRPLEAIHRRGGTRIFMAPTAIIIATMATIIATTPTILATAIIGTGIATKRNFEAASTGGQRVVIKRDTWLTIILRSVEPSPL